MFKKSELIRNHGLWLKIGLIALFFVSLGGMNCFTFIVENAKEPQYPTHNTGLDDWNQPEVSVGPEFEDWKSRKEAASKELEIVFAEAKAKGENYTMVDYFQDRDQLMALEDKHGFYLSSPQMLQPLLLLRDAKSCWKRYQPNDEELKYIASIQQNIQQRDGLYASSSDFNAKEVGLTCLFWLLPKYLILMLFWGLIYIIRFEEHDKAYQRLRRHSHELREFIDVEEPYQGKLSFYDEMLISPWRFALRMILWPKYCWNYPRYESPAQMLRFNRLKAEFLRYQPLGYQLTSREEAVLLARARKPVKDFEQAIASLFEMPVLVRRSVYLGYLSLVFGVLFQPAIALAASYSKKVDAHFYGNSQIVLVEHQKDAGVQIRAGTDLPSQPDQPTADWLDLPVRFELIVPPSLSERLKELPSIKPLQVLADILHIPLSGLLVAARCF